MRPNDTLAAEHHATFALKGFQGFRVADVITFAMCHRAGDDCTLGHFVREEGLVVFNLQLHFAADKAKPRQAEGLPQ